MRTEEHTISIEELEGRSARHVLCRYHAEGSDKMLFLKATVKSGKVEVVFVVWDHGTEITHEGLRTAVQAYNSK